MVVRRVDGEEEVEKNDQRTDRESLDSKTRLLWKEHLPELHTL